jgi:hypothetical protein
LILSRCGRAFSPRLPFLSAFYPSPRRLPLHPFLSACRICHCSQRCKAHHSVENFRYQGSDRLLRPVRRRDGKVAFFQQAFGLTEPRYLARFDPTGSWFIGNRGAAAGVVQPIATRLFAASQEASRERRRRRDSTAPSIWRDRRAEGTCASIVISSSLDSPVAYRTRFTCGFSLPDVLQLSPKHLHLPSIRRFWRAKRVLGRNAQLRASRKR